jgi:ASC-1-like (ASCH) protein
MKKYTLKFRAVDRDGWESLADGRKMVETRAATEKYRPIMAGDVLILTCGQNRIEKTIKELRHYSSVDEMLDQIAYKKIWPAAQSVEDLRRKYASFPGYEKKIAQFGIIAFELE